MHGVVILQKDLDDSNENYTRFVLLAPNPTNCPYYLANTVAIDDRNQTGVDISIADPDKVFAFYEFESAEVSTAAQNI